MISRYTQVKSKTFHEAYLLDAPFQQFNRQAFENFSDDYDLDYDFIESKSVYSQLDKKSLTISNGEIWSVNQKVGLCLTPRAKFDGQLKVSCQTVYLKRYRLDKKGNCTDTYDYEIYSRQTDGEYLLVERGSNDSGRN